MSKIIAFSNVWKIMAKEYHYVWAWDLDSSPAIGYAPHL